MKLAASLACLVLGRLYFLPDNFTLSRSRERVHLRASTLCGRQCRRSEFSRISKKRW
jgi:hypothetical protein